jgi:hypothetical protein
MNVKRLLGLVLVAGAVVFVTAGVVALVIANRYIDDTRAAAIDRLPPAWSDSMRMLATVPADVATLALERTADTNGAAVLWDSLPRSVAEGEAGAAVERLLRGIATASDSAAARRAAADTSLGWVHTLARSRRWDGLALSVAHTDTSNLNGFALAIPRYGRIRAATNAVLARARFRLEARDVAGAREDVRAVLSLGDWIARREPSVLGLLTGRGMIHRAAITLGEIGRATRDSGLAARSDAMATWAKRRSNLWLGLIRFFPDTALAYLSDTSLALGWRAEAVSAYVIGPVGTLRGILFGVPDTVATTIETLRHSSDADVAELARINAGTVRFLDHAGVKNRLDFSSMY